MPQRVIICQRPNSETPYDQWVDEIQPGSDLYVLTGADSALRGTTAPNTHLVTVPDYLGYDFNEALNRLAAVDDVRIISNSELDLLRVAETRTKYGIPGMKSDLAVCFRDKASMKQLFNDLPTPPAPWLVPHSAADVLTRCEQGPIVLKPRAGMGSVGVEVLKDRADCASILERRDVAEAVRSGALLIESYLPGAVYHADAYIHGHHVPFVSVSRYITPPNRFSSNNTRSVQIDESPVRLRIEESVRQLARSLPSDHGVRAIHFEFIEDEHGKLFAGEVGARVGGGLIKDQVLRSHGVDLSFCLTQLELGQTPRPPRSTGVMAGWCLEVGGPRIRPPHQFPEWLLAYVRVDEENPGSDSVAATAKALVVGRSENEVLSHLLELERNAGSNERN